MNDKEKIPVRAVISKILLDMKEQKYAEYTIYRYQLCYERLLEFMEQREQQHYNSSIGIEHIQAKFGITIEGLFGTYPPELRETIRALQVLWDYSEYGTVVIKLRPKHKPFECPEGFTSAIEVLKDDYIGRGLATQTHSTRMHVIKKFIIFINDAKVTSPEQIDANHIHKFISSYSAYSTRYIATIMSVLKTFLGLLFTEELVTADLRGCLPHVRIMRQAFVPSSWKVEDVQKMLNSIDRNNPLGKRDYAILLLVTRLGLRVSDIRNLRFGNLNWTRKTIIITMVKTNRTLELPLLKDIGWALIDYLKNGRPESKSDCVFIRQNAPYTGFSDCNTLYRMLSRRMNRAGISMKGQKHGLHSLRSTLARMMLEKGTSLPVISEVLGHASVQTTSVYLKIDLEGLRNCVIDPEEVFHG
jgi:site-specific recombinase XerD